MAGVGIHVPSFLPFRCLDIYIFVECVSKRLDEVCLYFLIGILGANLASNFYFASWSGRGRSMTGPMGLRSCP